ncbi:MAG: HIT domain-containing protein [Minisyncoccia bacterium]
MTDPNCIFCKIIKREIPGNILDENEDVIVFMSLENHPLVVPKKHITDIYSLDDKTGAEIMETSIRMAKRVKEEFKCDGIYITQANGPAAGQEVFHYHMHIYPRFNPA